MVRRSARRCRVCARRERPDLAFLQQPTASREQPGQCPAGRVHTQAARTRWRDRRAAGQARHDLGCARIEDPAPVFVGRRRVHVRSARQHHRLHGARDQHVDRDDHPYAVNWPDRRPIGALFLATSQRHPDKNPRGWFSNAGDVDVTTPGGLAKWRARLMKYADDSIKILKDVDAQGMITWDPEGEEFPSATYYGDPRLMPRLAPETDFTGGRALGALDEYFQKFQDAGLRTGLTLRPQTIEFRGGLPFQKFVENPTQELLDKIEYARARWGCTIFYIESSYDVVGSLNADVFRTIAERYPDILVMPENENFRDFVYSAPLNSFHHHNVTSTPASVREVYGEAFSTLLVTTTEEKMRAGYAALVDAVRRGDVLIVNAWYAGKHTEFVKSIYRDAGQ